MAPAAARQGALNVSAILCAAFQLALGRAADGGPRLHSGRHDSIDGSIISAPSHGNALSSSFLVSDERTKSAAGGVLFAGVEGATRTAAGGGGLYVPLTKRARTGGAVYGVDVSEDGISRRNLGGSRDDDDAGGEGGVGVEERGTIVFFFLLASVLNCGLLLSSPPCLQLVELSVVGTHAS